MKHFETHLLLEYAHQRMREDRHQVREERMIKEVRASQTENVRDSTSRFVSWLSGLTKRLRKQVALPQTDLKAECATCP